MFSYVYSKFLLDALPVAGTSGALHMMTELLTRKVVTGLEGSMWLTSLSFIKNPTQDMLAQVKVEYKMLDVFMFNYPGQRYLPFAYWAILHAFLLSADFFQN